MPKIVLSIAVDAELVKRLDRLAGAEDVSRSKMVRVLIESGISQHEATVKVLQDPTLMKAYSQMMRRPDVVKALGMAMTEELTDEQMKLFNDRMSQLSAAAVEESRPSKKPRKAK